VTAQVLDGEAVAREIRADLTTRAAVLAARGVRAGLGTILVGDDGPSARYVAMKHADCAEVGIESFHAHLPADATQREVEAAVARFNEAPEVDAFLLQYPFPAGLDYGAALLTADPAKDVDGLHPENEGRLLRGDPRFAPCTAIGIVELLRRERVPVEGSHVVIVGRGLLVGRPLAVLLSAKAPGANATVTLCHTGTRGLSDFTRQGDVLVAAAGRPAMITPDMVKPGAAVVDVGNHRVGGRIVGDVDPGVAEVAGALTPVPGGVGPMTVALLLANTVAAARAQAAR
jgi:methylenetetrahydrofolate dehydrogenase (NADP+)/methenyltetrahydrofolate cyclohydrolase